ncbi:LysR family transcriptional regulator [Acaryochloris marina S15]|nr:LysR family transcriptional regulator [Acaryochloris marina]QUY42773.1 LysR family transcriptional regulator [Acaryochloris marina S15]
MELSQLKYFVAIANHGSFTKAAETFYMTQPSLSAGIKKLEQE